MGVGCLDAGAGCLGIAIGCLCAGVACLDAEVECQCAGAGCLGKDTGCLCAGVACQAAGIRCQQGCSRGPCLWDQLCKPRLLDARYALWEGAWRSCCLLWKRGRCKDWHDAGSISQAQGT